MSIDVVNRSVVRLEPARRPFRTTRLGACDRPTREVWSEAAGQPGAEPAHPGRDDHPFHEEEARL